MDYLEFTNLKDCSVAEFFQTFYIGKPLLQKLLQNDYCKVNGNIQAADYLLKEDDVLSVALQPFEKNSTIPWDHPLDIVYEDDDLLIVNKPIGMLVHPDGNSVTTLANAVSFYFRHNKLHRQIRHIHRLDFETSGLIVFAKHFLAHSYLNYQMEHNLFEKTYLAIAEGNVQPKIGEICLPIGRNRHYSNRYLVSKTGKKAITKYRVLESDKKRSLLWIELETGRTHQIRVHFSYMHHPLIGDKIYGNTGGRLMLHAYRVGFVHPRTRQFVRFESSYPDGFFIKEKRVL